MEINLERYFERYGWPAEERESGVWVTQFSSEWDEKFSLFAFALGDWVHFGVAPVSPTPTAAAAQRLHKTLLRLNEGIPIVRFSLDSDGDVILQADMPAHRFSMTEFALVVGMLAATIDTWARPLARMAVDANYFPPELSDL